MVLYVQEVTLPNLILYYLKYEMGTTPWTYSNRLCFAYVLQGVSFIQNYYFVN